jgi:hypothetical protein
VVADEPLKWNMESVKPAPLSPNDQNHEPCSQDQIFSPGGHDPADLKGEVVISDYRMPKFGRASLVYRGVWHNKGVRIDHTLKLS